jgi:glucosyl-dolichyl phosphate glucuronosyltransferase
VLAAAAACPLATEVLVVDNSPSGTARTLVLDAAARAPRARVHHLSVPRRGKGYAYNAGISAAQGTVLLWTDDDVRVPEDWVARMAEPILGGPLDAVAGGVRLAPYLLRPWMTPVHRDYLASTEVLDPQTPVAMVGANMAFSKTVLSRVPAFDPELGPGALGFYDEALFSFQLKEAGFRLGSALAAEVEHHVDPNALLRPRWLKRVRDMGRSRAYVDYHWHHEAVPSPGRERLKAMWRLARKRVRHWRDTLQPEGCSEWEIAAVEAAAYFGQFAKETVRPRQYERRGLIKQPGQTPGAP